MPSFNVLLLALLIAECIAASPEAQTSCPDIHHCVLCNPLGTVCLKCAESYALNPLGGPECVQRCPRGASIMNDGGILICSWDSGSGGDEPSCESGCSACIEGKCAVCKEGYKMIQGVCEKDLSFQVVPNPDSCKNNECRIGDNCVPIDTTNCEFCPMNQACAKCKEGYCLSNDGSCKLPVDLNCRSCANNWKCSQCIDGYCLKSTNECIPKTDMKCLSCPNNGWCLQCEANHSPNAMGICTKCPDNCSYCTEDESTKKMKCTQCSSNYCLVVKSQNAGITCEPPTVFPNCESCGGGEYCIKCKAGHCLDPQQWYSGGHVSKSDIAFKSTLNQGYGAPHAVETCVPKDKSNCQTCNNGGLCTKCNNGFGLLPTGKCINIAVLMCAAYSEGVGCTKCHPGYCLTPLPDSGYMMCNQAYNCEYCQNGHCIQCSPGTCYFGDGLCTASACDSCRVHSGDGRCLQCVAGRCLNAHGVCMRAHRLHCVECQDNKKCTKCKDGYTLNDDGSCSISTKLDGQLKSTRAAAISVPLVVAAVGAIAATCCCIIMKKGRCCTKYERVATRLTTLTK